MNAPCIIALDQGTSSCRALAVDKQGQIRAQKKVLFSPQRPQKGISQYDARELLHNQLTVLHQLLDEIGPENAAALAVCSQRSTVVLWDKNTEQAVAPVLTWEDGRAVAQAQQAAISQEELHQQTGLFKAPFFSAPKIAWCLAHIPTAAQSARQGTLLAAPIASYLIWKLTAGKVFATDPTLAQRTLLWDIHKCQWSDGLCRQFGVPRECLPEIRPSAANYGAYVYKGVTIPIYACVADQQAAAVYHGLTPGDTTVNYGTGAFVLYHAGSSPLVLPGMLSSVAATTTENSSFLLEGPIFSAGSLLQWLQTKGVCWKPSQVDSLCMAATDPVHILPALGGLGAPYWDYNVSVSTEGATPATTAGDWLAGALQAIANRVADILYYVQAHGCSLNRITVSGGLSNSIYLRQTQANVLGRPIYTELQPEGTVLGTAQLAAQYLGWNTCEWTPPQTDPIDPNVSLEISHLIYHNWQQFVKRLRAVKSQ